MPDLVSCPTKLSFGQLTLAEFAGSGRTVALYSDVLECDVVLAADNARVSPSEARPVYRARELVGLNDWTPEGLRLLHDVKTIFGAEIQPPEPRKDVSPS